MTLIRHAEAASNASAVISGDPAADAGLTEAGRRQAERLSEILRDEPFDLCVTSRFPRAIETAQIALAGRQVPTVCWSSFDEPNAGEYEGGLVDDYLAWARQAPFEAAPSGGESLVEALDRYCHGYARLLAAESVHAVLVGHGLSISVILRAIESPQDRSRRFAAVPHAEPHRVTCAELADAVHTIKDHLIQRPP